MQEERKAVQSTAYPTSLLGRVSGLAGRPGVICFAVRSMPTAEIKNWTARPIRVETNQPTVAIRTAVRKSAAPRATEISVSWSCAASSGVNTEAANVFQVISSPPAE